MIIDSLRQRRTNAFDGTKILQPGPGGGTGGAEMAQQRSLPGRTDSGDLIKRRPRDVLAAPGSMRGNGEPVRFIAKPLEKVQHRVLWRQ